MKIQVLSDTHCADYTINPEAEVVVHLGDFGNGNVEWIVNFKDKCDDLGIPHLCVLGNHDFYGNHMLDVYVALDKYNMNYLTDGKEYKQGNLTFIGGTLFTAFKLNTKEPWDVKANKLAAQINISDFHYIEKDGKLVTPNDYVTMHNTQRKWIEKYRGRDDVVVCTHFPPNPVCLSDYWKEHGGKLNAYFINNIPLKGFTTWLCGHSHSAVDTVVDGCHVVINPLGYINEYGLSRYRPNLIVEV